VAHENVLSKLSSPMGATRLPSHGLVPQVRRDRHRALVLGRLLSGHRS
jgi:hypothetical protein